MDFYYFRRSNANSLHMLTEVDGEIDLYTKKLHFGQKTKPGELCFH